MRRRRAQPGLDSHQQPFDGLPSRGAEEIDGHDVGELLAQAQERMPRRLGADRSAPLGTDEGTLQPAGVLGQRRILGVSRGREQGLDVRVRVSFYESRFAHGGVAVARDDLPPDPLEVLEGLLAAR